MIWIDGSPKDEVIAVEAIEMIQEKAHVPGLTDKVKGFLEKKTGKPVEFNQEPPREQQQQTHQSFQPRPQRQQRDRRGPRRR